MNLALRILAAATLAGGATAASAQDSDALVGFNSMKPEVALTLAQAALTQCNNEGYQVAVAVVDRFGQTQVLIRDRFAGAHTVATATNKAWTAASFRTATHALDESIKEGTLSEGIRDIPGALVLGGGVPVEAAGSIVGGVGVSGAPGPEIDEACARAGIAAVADQLQF
jgi:uncharacterized protein GlcG (DUF336 family)